MTALLPIYDIEEEIASALQAAPRLVLQAPTGSGKSTQVPQMLLRRGFLGSGQVVILQPRRLAARLLATRVAAELGVALGQEVGYQVRFDNVTSPETRIKFETEGVLLRQMIRDPQLRNIQALIFDEFHERHLHGDISLARALDIQEQSRPDLRILVMSATLDAGGLEKYLAPCKVVRSEGRAFPVDLRYLPKRSGGKPPPVWELAAEAFEAYARPDGGDVLLFMPGTYEIHRTVEALKHTRQVRDFLVLPLHGELPPREQDAAVARYDRPKVVVATNVAETSITIDGVRLVIDGGLARIPRYDPNRGINTLLVERISQASADQRAGRAGRTAPGVCVRLWSESEHRERPARDLPEVKRLDLSEVVLTLKAAGIRDLRGFRWLDPPTAAALERAEGLLADLGALTVDEPGGGSAITEMGRSMLAFPLHPRYARMLIAAKEFDCVHDACLLAALTQGRDLLLRNPGPEAEAARDALAGDEATSDFHVLLRVWERAAASRFDLQVCRALGVHGVAARQVAPLHEQFLQIAKTEGLDTRPKIRDEAALRRCILIGFSDRVARRIDESGSRCELTHGRRGTLARDSVVRTSRLLVAAEVQEIGGKAGDVQTTVSLATAIELDWLEELFPGEVRTETRVALDANTRKVVADEVQTFRGLVAASKRLASAPREQTAALLAEEVLAGRLRLSKWDHSVEQWIHRVNLLSRACPDLGLPPIGSEDERHILEQICLDAQGYKDLKDKEVLSAVKEWLPGPQVHLVDRLAPERVTLSNGRTPKVTYPADGTPYVSLRIQELFGVAETPAIARGAVRLAVHILAPSMRPVQVTQDLANFWREHYPRIKSELQRKYPKHEWR